MSDAPLYDCSVCSEKTSMLCGGCEKLAFCSKEHQKLLRSTHKVLCENGGEWTMPPLSAEEVELLTERKDCPGVDGLLSSLLINKSLGTVSDTTILGNLKCFHLYDGTWEHLMDEMSSPGPSITGSARSAILSLLRSRLSDPCTVYLEGTLSPVRMYGDFPRTLTLGPWFHACQTASRFLVPPYNTSSDGSADLPFFRSVYPFFEQMLVAHTLYFAWCDQRTSTLKRFTHLAFDRARDMIAGMALPPLAEEELRGFVEQTRRLMDR